MRDKLLDELIEKITTNGAQDTDSVFSIIEELGVDLLPEELLEIFAAIYTGRRFLHTPTDIIRLIGMIGRELAPSSVIDVCCGTGGILSQFNGYSDLTGIEINEDLARLAQKVVPTAEIISHDFTLFDFHEKKFQIVLGDLPYGLPSETREPGELQILIKSLTLLKEGGIGIFMVPDTILSHGLFVDFRKTLLATYSVDAIISLPVNLYATNFFLKKSIIIIRKGPIFGNIFIVEYENNANIIFELFKNQRSAFSVNPISITDRLDFNHLNFERIIQENTTGKEIKKLPELAKLIRGQRFDPGNLKETGAYEIFNPYRKKGKRLFTDTISDSKIIVQPGDMIFSLNGLNELFSAPLRSNTMVVISDKFVIIRSPDNPYIGIYMHTKEGKEFLHYQMNRFDGSSFSPLVRFKALCELLIPILPVSELEIVTNDWIRNAEEDELINTRLQLQAVICNYEKINATLQKQYFETFFSKIETQLNRIEEKVDTTIKLLADLTTDILHIKNSHLNQEDKLQLISTKIDTKLNELYRQNQNTIEAYNTAVENWLEEYDLLHEFSQSFLTSAEFLLDEITKNNISDFSPFIIQYCRAIENEILKKIFEAYHENLENRKVDRQMLTKDDKSNETTRKFASFVENNKTDYTLGDMNFIMSLLKEGGKTLSNSPLLQDFREYVLINFEGIILHKEFLACLKEITSEYRNKSAHPYILSYEVAGSCQKLIRSSLNDFLNNYKKNQ